MLTPLTKDLGGACFDAAPVSLGVHRSGKAWTVAYGTPAGNHTTKLSADGCTLALTILNTLPFTPGGETGTETRTVELSFTNGAGTFSRQGDQFCIGSEKGTLVVTKK